MMKIALLSFSVLFFCLGLNAQCDAEFVAPTSTVCGGENINFTLTNPTNGFDYQWTADGNPIGDGISVVWQTPYDGVNQSYVINVQGVDQDSGAVACTFSTNVSVLATVEPLLKDVSYDPINLEEPFINCEATSSNLTYTLAVTDCSTPTSLIQSYTLEWGDGEMDSGGPSNLPDNLEHDYESLGFFTITYTIVATNGCVSVFTQQVFNGDNSNPGIGLNTPGNTVNICAPETINFPITNTENNNPGTTYFVFVNGQQEASYNHPPPAFFPFTFSQTSCGESTSDGNFMNAIDVRIEARTPCFSSESIVQPITIATPPVADFNIAPDTIGCLEDIFTFTNTTTGATAIAPNESCVEGVNLNWIITPNTYQLMSGALSGNSQNDANEIEVLFDEVGTYTIMLIAGNICEPDTIQQQVFVTPLTIANAEAAEDVINCLPFSITYNNLSENAITYLWTVTPNIGANINDNTIANPTISFSQTGTYIIDLTAGGCGSSSWQDTIEIADIPIVQLDPSPNSCGSNTYTFNPAIDPNGCPVESCEWSFTNNNGDIFFPGNTDCESLELFFDQPGTYYASFSATNCCGTSTVVDTFIISDPSSANAEAVLDDLCTPTVLNLNNLSTNYISNLWEINTTLSYTYINGTSATSENPVVQLNEPGTYPILLTVFGCDTTTWDTTITVYSDPAVALTPIDILACDAITFTPQVFVTDGGCDTICRWVTTTLSGDTIQVYPDCSPPEIDINITGDYILYHEVTNCCSTVWDSVHFSINEFPTASASYSLDTSFACTPTIITFNNTSSFNETNNWTVDPPNGAVFVNGTNENSTNPSIQFNDPNVYTVQLLVGNDCGTAIWDTTVVVYAAPNIDLVPIPDAEECGAISFTPELEEFTDGGCLDSCRWMLTNINGDLINTFPDCSPPMIDINIPDTYILAFEVTNCCSTVIDADTFLVSEFPIAAASYQLDTTYGCAPVVIDFNNTSSFNAFNDWSVEPSNGVTFVNGTDENSENPSIQFEEPGTFNVELFIGNICDSTTWDTTVVIYGSPSAQLDTIPDACDELSFTPSINMFDDGNCETLCSLFLYRDGSLVYEFMGCDPELISLNTPGNYLLELQLSNCCDVTTIEDTFFIQGSTSVEAGQDTSLCEGDPCLPLPPSGIWTDEMGNAVSEFCPQDTGTFTFILSQTTGLCTGSDTLNITVNPRPDVEIFSPTSTLCVNAAPIQLTANLNPGVWFSTSNGLSDTGLFDPALAGVGMHTIIYTHFDTFPNNSICEGMDSIEILVNDLDALSLDDITLCEVDQDIDLEFLYGLGDTGNSVIWQGPGIIDETNGIFNSIQAGANGVDTAFQIIYQYENAFGCVYTDSIIITIVPPTLAYIGEDTTVCISDISLQLNANLAGDWDGTGIISPSGVVDLINTGAGIFEFYFVAFEGESCETRDTIIVSIIDMGAVEAGDDLFLCETESIVTLSGFSTPDSSIAEWSGISFLDPINGIFDVQELVPGTFTLYYTATSTILNSCSAYDSLTLTIDALPLPDFSIEGEPCIGEPINFVNTSTGADAYQWCIDNVPVSNNENFSNTFDVSADYEIKLIAYTINPSNLLDTVCVDTATQVLHISEPPTFIGFEATPDTGCADLQVLLTNLSIGENLSFEWYLDGNLISMADDSLTIILGQGISDTTYTISLQVNNNCGGGEFSQEILVRPRPTSIIGTSQPTFCSGEEIPVANLSYGEVEEYEWYVNGNLVDTGFTAPVIQWFTDSVEVLEICLVASNECDTDTFCIYPNVEPTNVDAFFFVDTTSVCVGDSVCFTNLSSPWASIVYDFGDESGSVEENPCHAYDTPGSYDAVLSASDCGFDSFLVQINVFPLPEADFDFTGIYCPGSPISFTNLSINGQEYNWDFDDGDSTDINSPEHTFAASGTYNVCLTVLSAQACEDVICKEVTIEALPIAAIQAVDSICLGDTIIFSSENIADVSGCNWIFSDGFMADGCVVERDFNESGDFSVSLFVSNPFGCQDSTTRIIHVRPTPEANFSYEIIEPCVPGAIVRLFNTSIDETGINWFIDGIYAGNEQEFEYELNTSGEHTLELIASNDGICENRFEQTIMLQESPRLDFDLDFPCNEKVTDLIISVDVPASFDVQVFNASYDQSGVLHQGLLDGTYEVMVNADNGCTKDTTLNIIAPDTLSIDLDPEVATITLGESVEYDLTSNQTGTVSWNPPLWLNDTASFRPVATPLTAEPVSYVVSVTGEDGCIKLDTAFIFVEFALDSSIYIPNVFTPNGDGRNDLFRVRSEYPAVNQVALFQIFDRNGTLVFQAEDYDPQELPLEANWDGTINDEPALTGYYTWLAKVEYKDGSDHTFHGQVLLMR